MQENRVSVKIYGQEYIITGEKDKEYIRKVADHVDGKMHEIAKILLGANPATIAVLAAVNIVDEYYELETALEEQKKLTSQMEADAQRYVELWDEAKKNFLVYKEESNALSRQKEELVYNLNQKDLELQSARLELENKIEKAKTDSETRIKELTQKCKELEDGFFELQMENIRMKSEVEKYKRDLGIEY